MNNYFSTEMRRFNHLLHEIDSAYHEMSMKLGLSDSAMIILYTICERGDSCPLLELCRRSGISKQTINSAIRKLETEGIVYLEMADAKKKIVCLTQQGRQLAERTAVRMIEAENEIFASWPKEDVEQYLELTKRFEEALREKTKALG